MSDDDDDEETDSDDDEESSDEEDEEATGNAWASSSKTKTDESINDLPATSKTGTSYGCCHISHNNLQLLVPVRQSCECHASS